MTLFLFNVRLKSQIDQSYGSLFYIYKQMVHALAVIVGPPEHHCVNLLVSKLFVIIVGLQGTLVF